METLRLERDGHVGWLRLDRPDRLNSFTPQMWWEMRALGAELRDDPDLRVLVVIGEGRAFSSGIDTSVFADALDRCRRDRRGSRRRGTSMQTRSSTPCCGRKTRSPGCKRRRSPPLPLFAAMRSAPGSSSRSACDLRVVAEGTQLGLLELKYGIIPDLGGTQRLPRLVGAGKAKELIFTSAKIDAAEAARIGLAERVVADAKLESTVTALASAIAAQPPLAVRGVKRAIDAAFDTALRDGLRVEAESQAVCLQSDDMKEAISAFVEQRTPDYRSS